MAPSENIECSLQGESNHRTDGISPPGEYNKSIFKEQQQHPCNIFTSQFKSLQRPYSGSEMKEDDSGVGGVKIIEALS